MAALRTQGTRVLMGEMRGGIARRRGGTPQFKSA